jgi:hypothetical protein
MPLVAYQGPHGSNDYPLHFAFFEAMEKRGVLDRVDFALDPFHDLAYCKALRARFPQLLLTTEQSIPSKLAWLAHRTLHRGAGLISRLPGRRFDAVCEGPGGRIHPQYHCGSLFWRHPRVRRRAVLFHSVEEGILRDRAACESIASCDLVVARSNGTCAVAMKAGLAPSKVCTASDIVFTKIPAETEYRRGYAVALRVPLGGGDSDYSRRLCAVLDYLDAVPGVDHVSIEKPFDDEQKRRGYAERGELYTGDEMYRPFEYRRDAVVSCRLHTTLIALLSGNRRILQYQVEGHTRKLHQIFSDIGLESLRVRSPGSLCAREVQEFLEAGESLDDAEVEAALHRGRKLVEQGLDRACEWLESV